MSKNHFTTSGGIEHDLKFKGVWSLGVAIQGETPRKIQKLECQIFDFLWTGHQIHVSILVAAQD